MTSSREAYEREIAAMEAEDDDDLWDRAVRAKAKPTRTPSQVYSVRIPVDQLERLRRHAVRAGTTPSDLIRTWVLERLDASEQESRLGPPASGASARRVARASHRATLADPSAPAGNFGMSV